MNIFRHVLLLLGVFWLLAGSAYAADNCSEEQRDAQLKEVRTPIGPESKDRVYIRCDLTLGADENIKKRLVVQGDAISGVTINCNGATLDGGESTPNAGGDMIIVRSLWVEKDGSGDPKPVDEEAPGGEITKIVEGVKWLRPVDITIRNCKVIGSMRIRGMGGNGEGRAVRSSSRLDANHIERVRAAAPERINLDRMVFTATGRTPLYIAPGVTRVTVTNSEFKGNGTRAAVYLDAESGYNVLKNNSIHVKLFDEWQHTFINRLSPQVSIDTSSHNKIIGNHFSALEGGGVHTFRNCGEGGTVRHGSSSHNEIINNDFYYNKYEGGNAAIHIGAHGEWYRNLPFTNCTKDDGFPWGSGANDNDESRHNIVMENRIIKRKVSEMIREGDDSSPNTFAHNETVATAPRRPSGCYVANGYKNFIRHGQRMDVHKGGRGLPECGKALVCSDGEISVQESTGCDVRQVPFSCAVERNNAGCQAEASCPGAGRVVASRAACNLEQGQVSQAELDQVPGNTLSVVRASSNVSNGRCWVGDTDLKSGSAPITAGIDQAKVSVGCREHDENGGDCHISGMVYCR